VRNDGTVHSRRSRFRRTKKQRSRYHRRRRISEPKRSPQGGGERPEKQTEWNRRESPWSAGFVSRRAKIAFFGSSSDAFRSSKRQLFPGPFSTETPSAPAGGGRRRETKRRLRLYQQRESSESVVFQSRNRIGEDRSDESCVNPGFAKKREAFKFSFPVRTSRFSKK